MKTKSPKIASRTIIGSQALRDEDGAEREVADFQRGETIFTQGNPADSVMYIENGGVKLSVVNEMGKEAVIAMCGPGDFFGEGCMAGQPIRTATATAIKPTTIVIIGRGDMRRMIDAKHDLADHFIGYVLARNIRVEQDLIDQLFNSCEKRLARTLLLLAHDGKQEQPDPVLLKVSQETLAEMIGTTRSRVNFFMNKFRRLGFVNYNGKIQVNHSLLKVVSHESGD